MTLAERSSPLPARSSTASAARKSDTSPSLSNRSDSWKADPASSVCTATTVASPTTDTSPAPKLSTCSEKETLMRAGVKRRKPSRAVESAAVGGVLSLTKTSSAEASQSFSAKSCAAPATTLTRTSPSPRGVRSHAKASEATRRRLETAALVTFRNSETSSTGSGLAMSSEKSARTAMVASGVESGACALSEDSCAVGAVTS